MSHLVIDPATTNSASLGSLTGLIVDSALLFQERAETPGAYTVFPATYALLDIQQKHRLRLGLLTAYGATIGDWLATQFPACKQTKLLQETKSCFDSVTICFNQENRQHWRPSLESLSFNDGYPIQRARTAVVSANSELLELAEAVGFKAILAVDHTALPRILQFWRRSDL